MPPSTGSEPQSPDGHAYRRFSREASPAADPAIPAIDLALVVLDGMSYKDAAQTLDIPIGPVMSRLARARRLLVAILDSSKKDASGHD